MARFGAEGMTTAEPATCQNCGGRQIEPTQRYCGSCGHSFAPVCPSCGEPCPAGFNFCGSCGADLSSGTVASQSGEERRVLTVLFADLVEFTSRSERLDPEDVHAFLEPYYTCLRDEIRAFGGEVEKYVGDAVVGVFGAPTAHGDDPERAVRAALRIRDSLAEMNAADSSLDLQVRIAVNTGEAIVTAKKWAGEAMVAGDSVNTAAAPAGRSAQQLSACRRGDLSRHEIRNRLPTRRLNRGEGKASTRAGVARYFGCTASWRACCREGAPRGSAGRARGPFGTL